MYEQRLSRNLPPVRERIAAALMRAGRTDDVQLIAVTKTHPLDAVAAAVAAGLSAVGENRVQELDEKREAWAATSTSSDGAPEWHLIGHLQRNKARRAIELAHLIHSVDSIRLARELSKEAERAGSDVRVLVQVNVSGEDSKSGFDAARATDEIAAVAALPGLSVEGLMTMAPFVEDDDIVRATFAGTRRLLEQSIAAGTITAGATLSMGMSGDYEIAIEEGSTMIRLGTTLFGERQA